MTIKILLILIFSTVITYIVNPVPTFAAVNYLTDCAKLNDLPKFNKATYVFKGIVDGNLYNNIKMENDIQKYFQIKLDYINQTSNYGNGSLFFEENNNMTKYLDFNLTDTYTQCAIVHDESKQYIDLIPLFHQKKYCADHMSITFEGVTYMNINQNTFTEPKTMNLVVIYKNVSGQGDKWKGNIQLADKYDSLDVQIAEFSCTFNPGSNLSTQSTTSTSR